MDPDPAVEASVTAAALDYYEGWFDGDAERMRRALHPGLVKRALLPDGSFDVTTAAQLIEGSGAGAGRARDVPDRRIAITVHHVHNAIANATVTSAVYVDYLHLVRGPDGWRIVHAAWDYA
jgi:hypothetical protein